MEKIFSRSIKSANSLLSSLQMKLFKDFIMYYREKIDAQYKATGLED